MVTSKRTKRFSISVTSFPQDSGIICKNVTTSIKIPTSTELSQYECFNCPSNAVGSFVYLEHLIESQNLQFCDIKVSGTFKKIEVEK